MKYEEIKIKNKRGKSLKSLNFKSVIEIHLFVVTMSYTVII